LSSYAETVNESLSKITEGDKGTVNEAMRYSLLSGGKRTRASLILSVCEMLHGDSEAALLAADAVEMLHCYSLIHDDLPCMDDDDYRRGQLSCHKKYGEATAMLAGDALLTNAFNVLSMIEDPVASQKCVALLAEAAGHRGMILGQELDLAGIDVNREVSAQLDRINRYKTGKLITVSLLLGAVCSGVYDGPVFEALRAYGERIGLVFQIVDDVLDVTSSLEELGKMTGSDAQNDKATYCSVYGVDGAMERARELTDECVSILEDIENSDFLEWYAYDLLNRTK